MTYGQKKKNSFVSHPTWGQLTTHVNHGGYLCPNHPHASTYVEATKCLTYIHTYTHGGEYYTWAWKSMGLVLTQQECKYFDGHQVMKEEDPIHPLGWFGVGSMHLVLLVPDNHNHY